MSRWRRFFLRLSNVFRSGRSEPELAREIASHLSLLEDDFQRRGMTPEDARLAARRAFGGVEQTKELQHDARSFRWMDDIRRDVQYALRMLRRTPGFTAVAVLTLALGIGANTAIFSLVNSLVPRTLPVVEPQRLATVSSATAVTQGRTAGWSYVMWDQLQQRSHTFEGAAAWSGQRFNLAQSGETELVDGVYASADFFTTLGVPALVGRTFTSADDVRGGGPDGPAAVISYGFWQRRCGGAAGVVGRALVVEGVPFTIVGVTPPAFFGAEVGRSFDVALPIGAEPLIHGRDTWLDAFGRSFLTVVLRLKPGQSLDAATATLRGVQPQMFDAVIPPGRPPRVREEFLADPLTLVPAAAGTSILRQQYERPLLTILAVVALVLLIACANIANLLLARAAARRHELSVRLALGAPRWRLAQQLLIESLVLAGIGAAVGLLFAAWSSRALVAQLSTSVNQVFLDLSFDWRVMAFTAGITVLTAVIFGTAPAFRATRVAPIDALKERGRSASGDARASVSAGLVVTQVALSLVLVVAAGLFVGTFARLASVPLGFDSARVLVVNVNATRIHSDPAGRLPFYQRLVDAVAAVPGVARAAASQMTPVNGGIRMIGFIDAPGGQPMSERERSVLINFVTPEFFRAYDTAIRFGRDISDRDSRQAPWVVVVNDAFVRKFFPGGNAIGRTVMPAFAPPGEHPRGRTIVGVVGDAVARSLRDEVPPTMYQPMAQWDFGGPPAAISISVRSSAGSPALLARSVAAALTAVDADLSFSFRPLADQVNASLTQERLVAILSGFFGALALLLAGLGLYGVTSYTVTRRRTEIGIRMALGAQRADVVRLVLGGTIVVTAVGIVVGLAGAAAVTRYLEGMLFGVTALDPATFVAVTLIFGAVTALAAFVPARRATTVDPAIALRCE